MTLNVLLERRRRVGDDAPVPSTDFPPQIQARRPTTSGSSLLLGERRRHGTAATAIPSASLAVSGAATELAVRAGGGVLTITVTVAEWVAAGATFNAQRQAIIDGIDGALDVVTGWDAVVRAALAVTDVVRTSASVVTVTLPAAAAYAIPAGASELVTVTIPGAALTTSLPLVAGAFSVASSTTPTRDVTPRLYLHSGSGARVRQVRGVA